MCLEALFEYIDQLKELSPLFIVSQQGNLVALFHFFLRDVDVSNCDI